MKRKTLCCWLECAIWFALTAGSPAFHLIAETVAPPVISQLSLDEAIRLALAQNPDLRASVARVDAAAGRAWQAKRWPNPDLELNAEDWPVSHGHGFSDAKQTLGISQVLPFPGKKSLDRKIGGANVKLSEAEVLLHQTELIRNVKASYFRVLASERSIAVSSQLVSVAEASASTARKRVDAGASPYQEQLRAEVQLEQARTELAEVQRELAMARQLLATLLGRPDTQDARLTGNLVEVPDAALLSVNPTDFIAGHPSAKAAQANLDRAQLESRRARLEPYPDVKVSVAGGRIGETDESIIELGFSVPVPIIDHAKGKKQEARANVTVAEAELVAVRQQLRREFAGARQRCQVAMEQVANYRGRILPKASEAQRLVQIGFEQGKFNFIDLVDTQRTLAEAGLAYEQKLLEMNVAIAELQALIAPQTRQSVISQSQ
jgi:outer membrane protein, heavy metal efflux system